MQAKPFHVWAQERAAAESAAERKLREAALGSQAIGLGLDSLKPQPAPTVHKPTHDWDRSAMFAAERAAGLEKMDKAAQLDRESDLFKMQLRAKFAPKKGGGAGPVSKLTADYLKTFDEVPADDTQAKRRESKLAFLQQQIARYGGSRVLADLDKAGMGPAGYKATGKHGMTKELAEGKAQQADKAAQAKAESAALEQQAQLLGQFAKPPQGGFERDEDKKKREALQRQALEAAQKRAKVKVTDPTGAQYTVEED